MELLSVGLIHYGLTDGVVVFRYQLGRLRTDATRELIPHTSATRELVLGIVVRDEGLGQDVGQVAHDDVRTRSSACWSLDNNMEVS